MKKSWLLVLFAFGLASAAIQDKQVIWDRILTVQETQPDTKALWVNGTEIKINPDKSLHYQVFFGQYGKNVLSVKRQTKSGEVLVDKYRFLVLRPFKDAKQKIYAELGATGLYTGYEDKTIRLNNPITQEEAVAVLSRAKITDEPIAWFDTANKPKRKISRAEAIVALCKLEKIDPIKPLKEVRFKDLNEQSNYFGYICAADKLGWLQKYGTYLMPGQTITRGEFLDLLLKLPSTERRLAELRDWDKGFNESVSIRVYARELISLSFESMELAEIVKLIAKENGLNVVMGPEVKGKISGHFADVYPETALYNVLQSAGYSYVLDGNLYRVCRDKNNSNEPKNKAVREFKIRYADLQKVETELVKLIPSLKNKIVLGTESNTLLIKGDNPDVLLAESVIQKLDAVPLQVMVEAKIFEVNAEEAKRTGLQFGVQNSIEDEKFSMTYGETKTADNPISVYSLKNNQTIQAYIAALEAKSDFNMLSSPKIMAMNNKEAILETTSEVAYQDETITFTTAGQVTSKKLIFKDVGTKLKFIPHINEEGYISLDLYPEISTSITDANTGYPLTQKTTVHTQAVIQDGEVFLLGGLLRDRQENVQKKTLLLGDLPLIGGLFRRTEKQIVKKEVIIMIESKIIQPESNL